MKQVPLLQEVDMKSLARIIIAAMLVLLLGSITESDARGGHSGHGSRGGVGVWLGPGWGWPYYFPSYYPYYPPEQRIVIEQPEVYVQPAEEQQRYWYYCTEQQGYYPYVKECPSGWMKVVPSPPPPPISPSK